MKKKGILVLVIVLLLGLVKFWIPGVIQRYDKQQHVDTTPDTLAYLFFGIGESENEGIDVHQAVLEQKTLDSFKTVSEGIYSLDYYGDIREDEYLDANIKTVEEFDRRYAMISKALEEKENMSDKDAMEVLESVSRMTRWSAVYDLDHFDVEICFRGDYENSYSYSGRE